MCSLPGKIQRQVCCYAIILLPCTDLRSRAIFTAHCDEHTKTQEQLQRPAGRTYGARYKSDKPRNTPQPTTSSTLPRSDEQAESDECAVKLKEAVPQNVNAQNATEKKGDPYNGPDKSYHDIICKFPPYEGDGVEKQIVVS